MLVQHVVKVMWRIYVYLFFYLTLFFRKWKSIRTLKKYKMALLCIFSYFKNEIITEWCLNCSLLIVYPFNRLKSWKNGYFNGFLKENRLFLLTMIFGKGHNLVNFCSSWFSFSEYVDNYQNNVFSSLPYIHLYMLRVFFNEKWSIFAIF